MTAPIRTPPAIVLDPAPRRPPARAEVQMPRTATGQTYSVARHLRAALVLVVATVLLVGVAYPLALVGFGAIVNPHGANGSLVYNPNGTVNHSQILPPGVNSTFGGWSPLPGHPALGTGPGRNPSESISYRQLAAHLGDPSDGRPGPSGPSASSFGPVPWPTEEEA